MAYSGRAKRVTDPLHDEAKARIIGKARPEPFYASSGSEHGRHPIVDDDDSPCLSDLVDGFFVGESGEGAESTQCESDSGSDCDSKDAVDDIANPEIVFVSDPVRNVILSHVLRAVSIYSNSSTNRAVFRRNVMGFLRHLGFNAAVCKTKWETSGGLTSGNYEFIDVIVRSEPKSSQLSRYFVELDFPGEFEIARATESYERLFKALPRVYVGKCEELKKIVKVMCDASRRSLKSRGLSLPPWRKNRYMQNKWFGPYRRTTNVTPTNAVSVLPPPIVGAASGFSVKSRCVGFNGVSGHSMMPATARTR